MSFSNDFLPGLYFKSVCICPDLSSRVHPTYDGILDNVYCSQCIGLGLCPVGPSFTAGRMCPDMLDILAEKLAPDI